MNVVEFKLNITCGLRFLLTKSLICMAIDIYEKKKSILSILLFKSQDLQENRCLLKLPLGRCNWLVYDVTFQNINKIIATYYTSINCY